MGAARGATAALILITAAAMAGCAHSDEGPSSDEAVRPAATQARDAMLRWPTGWSNPPRLPL